MKASILVRIAVSVAIIATAGFARATTMVPLSLEELVDRSDVVARVRVESVQIEQRVGAPFRVTELVVIEPFQGAQPGERLHIWQRGDGNIIVIGDPWLEPGDEGLAFLRRVDGRHYLTALAQSFWWISDQSGERVAARDVSGVRLVPLGEPRVTPPDRASWRRLRQMVLDACVGVSP